MPVISKQDAAAACVAIVGAIDDYCIEHYNDGHRNHLGASLIGKKCDRHLWYTFRWIRRPVFSGRMLRLFNRGHREEARFIEWLEGIGFEVEAVLEGAQDRIVGVEGHFGGSMDGKAVAPEWLENVRALGRILLEFKTSGTGRSFTDLRTKGVEEAKPVHYGQMCSYGYKKNIEYALYLCINNNDDDLYVELVWLDHKLGAQLEARAHNVITAQTPPPRISESPAWFDCKWCDHIKNCHHGEPSERNCRSCKNGQPIADAQWRCNLSPDAGPIPKDFIPKGCGNWQDINA